MYGGIIFGCLSLGLFGMLCYISHLDATAKYKQEEADNQREHELRLKFFENLSDEDIQKLLENINLSNNLVENNEIM